MNIISFISTYFSPAIIAEAACTSPSCVGSFGTFVEYVIYLISKVAIPVLLTAAVVVFFYGIIRTYIWETDPATINKNKFYVAWGLGGIFVMLAIWGIINVISSSIGIGIGGDIVIPQFK
ncbi:MAG TPA: hypothetical protein VGE63_01455 [Candidatus Paceibacterota bacterium]